MKVLLFILTLGLSGIDPKGGRLPASRFVDPGCDPRETSLAIRDQKRLPRSSLFHYGKRDLLLKDVSARTIPEADWNEFIMGENTRFKLKRFRRGFYATESPEDADRFGDSTYNWMVEVVLKPECLTPSRVTSLAFLTEHEAFRNWFQEQHPNRSFEGWKKLCFDESGFPEYGQFNYYKNPKEEADAHETECEKVVGDYFISTNPAFVQDQAGDLIRSWAIRDRSCIQTILGSDEYWIRELPRRPEFWKNSCDPERNHRNLIRIWFSALARNASNSESIRSFKEMILKLPAPEDRLDWQTQETDRFAAQDFATALESASRRCGEKQKNELRTALQKFADQVDSLQSEELRNSLESLCR